MDVCMLYYTRKLCSVLARDVKMKDIPSDKRCIFNRKKEAGVKIIKHSRILLVL